MSGGLSLRTNTEPFFLRSGDYMVVAPSDRAGQTTIAGLTELNRV